MIIVVTLLLLTRALRSVVLPLKALLLNVVSLGAAYGITVLIWQHGLGVQILRREDYPSADASGRHRMFGVDSVRRVGSRV